MVLLADTACSRQDLGASVGDRKAWSCGFCGHLGLVTLLKTVCGRRMPQIRNQKKGTCQLLSAGVWVPCHTQGQPGSCQTEKQQATSLAGLPTLEAGVSGPLGRMQGAKARKGEKKSGLHTSSGKFTTHTRFAKNRPRLASNARRTSPNGGHARKSLNSFFARRTAGCRVPAPSKRPLILQSYAAGVACDCMGRTARRPVCSPTPSPMANCWRATPALPCSHQARGQLPGVGAAQHGCFVVLVALSACASHWPFSGSGPT